MKTIQKLLVSLLLTVAIQSSMAAVFHPITKCASLTFTDGALVVVINAPIGNNPWNFTPLGGSGTYVVTDCDNVRLGTYNVSTGVFTP